MRLSVSKRSNPFKEDELKEDMQSHLQGEESKVAGVQKKISPIKDGSDKADEHLNSAKNACMANNETHGDALAKLMNNRHRQNEILEELDKIYTCSICLKQIKLYDAYNDTPDKCMASMTAENSTNPPDIELVDETEFNTSYKCSECYNVACPSCMSKSVAYSQGTCTTCSTSSTN